METEVTSISTNFSTHAMQTPRERIQDELEAQAASGAIKATDVDALTEALDQIDAEMTQGMTGASGPGGRPSPEAIGDKISGLIDELVDNGKLTSDQAEELKGVFADAMPKGGPGPLGGMSEGQETDNTLPDTDQLIAGFLKMLQDAQSKATGYGADGSTSAQQTDASMLFSYLT
jgi:hypothetical protein